jgi:ATP-dependent RNA helicase DeaD
LTTAIVNSVAAEAIPSAADFAGMRLSPTTLQALARMGIETPTPIQAAALPALLDGRDVIGQARTGSGKTLAFGIPAVEFVDTRARGVQVLVLTPTRELAVQVGGVLEEVGRGKGVTVGLIFGGRPLGPQRDLLRRGVHVVVGTPGRVLDLLNQGALWLDKVRLLVLDEADEMLDQGFAPDVERILARATSARQTVLFSATVPDWVRQTADHFLDRPVSVAVDPNPEDAAPIPHVAYDVPNGDKLGALKDLLDHRGAGSIIVFGRTKHGVKKLAKQLAALGYPAEALQAAQAALTLMERRLEAEQSRFDVGLSTNFFVVQAQRDLRDAQNAELRALLDYRRAQVDFERVQEIPAGGGGGGITSIQAGGGQAPRANAGGGGGGGF